VSGALIFDCDGVVVDVETTRHRQAFNQVWREDGVDWQWGESDYARTLVVSGGRERLRLLYEDPRFRAVFDVPANPDEWDRLVASWHRRKTRIYTEMVRAGVTCRSGIRRLAAEAIAEGWRLAVASSGARQSVTAVLRAALPPEVVAELTVITGEQVARKKPDPGVYLLAAQELGVRNEECVVVEDTCNGMHAAAGAGMTCVVTPTAVNFHDDFYRAALVVTGLGEPGGPPEVAIGGRCWLRARAWLSLDDLAELAHLDTRFRSNGLARAGGGRT